MTSGRSNPIEQEPSRNWLEIAKRKWSGASITGSGSHSVRLMNGRDIRLFPTFKEAAEFCSQSPTYKYLDLAAEPVHKMDTICGNIKSMSDYEDRCWERRQERERQQAELEKA